MPIKLLHILIWFGGLLFGLIPFLKQHHYSGLGISPYLGENYFGSHVLIALGLASTGATAWGGLSRWISSGDPIEHKAKSWMSFTLATLVILLALGGLGFLSDYAYLAAAACVALIVIFGSVKISHHPAPSLSSLRKIGRWSTYKKPWNGPFFLALFGLLLWHNYQMIIGMRELSDGHMTSLFVSRMFTQLALTALLQLVVRLSLDTGPNFIRPFVWFVASLAPITIIIDLLMRGFWNRSFLDFINGLGANGILHFDQELKGGGIELSISAVIAIFVGVIILFCFITYLCSKLARKWKFHTAPIWTILIVLIGFSGATLEQAIGKNWKTRRNWMQEYNEFGLLISPVRPPEGLAYFDVEFRDHTWLYSPEPLQIQTTPDIYFVFIESFRADALRPDVTPFLHEFSQNDAQPIDKTWAASNGTHLSWFSTLSSQAAIHRESSRDTAIADQWPGLKSFHLLKDAGYTLNMHAASDLDFRDIGPHFFGKNGSPFQKIRENIPTDPIFEKELPERERMLFNDLKSQLSSRQKGGHFDILTIDSTHYKYSWHESFTPPFPDYYPYAFFPATPSVKEIELIKNQYFNSLAWADHLAKDFCDHLKSLDRYDDSIIIFLGDHGEEFQDHGGWLHVSSLENEQVCVPMLVKWPKSQGRGPALPEASHLDLLPSILSSLGNQSDLDTAGLSFFGNDTPRTSIVTTAQGGVTKEGLLLTRGDFKAYFTWPRYFTGRPGDSVILTRFSGPDGDIELKGQVEYTAALEKHFPDAFQRFFNKFEPKQQEVED